MTSTSGTQGIARTAFLAEEPGLTSPSS